MSSPPVSLHTAIRLNIADADDADSDSDIAVLLYPYKNTSFLFYSFCMMTRICWTIYAILVVAGRGRERRVLPFVVVTEDAGCCRSSLRKE